MKTTTGLPLYPSIPSSPKEGDASIDATIDESVCRRLRTKMAFSAMVTPSGEPVRWQRGEGSTATYWCLSTMECAGPDDGLVHAEECRKGRGCFQE